MIRLLTAVLLLLLLSACSNVGDAGVGRGMGVTLNSDAVTYFGTPSFCSNPATFDADEVLATMSEWKEIQRDGVSKESSRYQQKMQQIHRRLVDASKRAATKNGNDLVVREGDIKHDGGYEVADLTKAIIDAL